MSKELLYNLNGNRTGEFKKFLDGINGEPRIAWYPSAGEDFRALIYLDPSYSKINPATRGCYYHRYRLCVVGGSVCKVVIGYFFTKSFQSTPLWLILGFFP